MHRHDHYRDGLRGTVVVILINLGLCAVKFAAGFIAGSHALIADALHTASDLFSSLIVLVGLKIASAPADAEHPYGHGKAEAVAAKLVSITLIILGIRVALGSLNVIRAHDFHVPGITAAVVAFISIVVKEIQFQYAYRVGKRIQSTSLVADAWHHRSDAISSVAALIGVCAAYVGYPILDPLAGVIVALFVIKIGFDMFRRAYDELLDKTAPKDVLDRIAGIARGVEGVKRVSMVKTRKAGLDMLIDMTIEVEGRETVESSHRMTALIRRTLLKELPHVQDAFIHVEPFRGK